MFYHSQIRFYALPVCGVRFLRPRFFIFITNLPSSPHTSSHMRRPSPGDGAATVRLAGRKRRARFESSEALRTHSLRDQLDSADAGSWQIADRYNATAS